jgi:hypothetical protein
VVSPDHRVNDDIPMPNLLTLAVVQNAKNTLNLLLKHGLGPSFAVSKYGHSDWLYSPLDWAVVMKHDECADQLQANCVDDDGGGDDDDDDDHHHHHHHVALYAS